MLRASPKALSLFLAISLPIVASAQETGQIVVYLEKVSPPAVHSVLSFSRMVLRGDETAVLNLLVDSLSSEDLARQQILLAEAEILPGIYRKLSFSIAVQAAPAEELDSVRSFYQQEVNVPLEIGVAAGAAQAIFLHWEQALSADTTQPPTSSFSPVRKKLPPRTAQAFVSNEGSDNLSILDLQAGEVVGCLGVGQAPRGLVIARQNGYLFVANSQSNTISVMDVQSLQPRGEINLDYGDEPQALCLSADERRLFVANHGSNSVTVVDAQRLTVLSKVSVGSAPLDIAADPAGGWIYVANSLSDDISVLNPETLELSYTLQAGSFPAALEIVTSEKTVYVANFKSGYLTLINTGQIAVAGPLNLNRGIRALAADAFTGTLFCLMEDLDYVSIFRPGLNIELSQVPVGDKPIQAAFDRQSRLLYVCCWQSHNIYVINKVSGRVERTIAAGRNPYMVVFP